MQKAETETTRRPIDRAVLFRDGLIIALLALRPIRRKNLAALHLGTHLHKTVAGWRLFLPAEEVKNHQEYETQVPPAVGESLERYLAAYRPILLASARQANALAQPHVWISSTGRPLAANRIWKQVSTRTGKAFGQSVPPHFFRDCAMTTWALDLSKQVRGGVHVLGNRSFAVAESAYNMAGSNIAASKLQGALAAVRRNRKGQLRHRRRRATIPADQER
jgi:integrase/recombinase XerD